MHKQELNRRGFLKQITLAAVCVPMLDFGLISCTNVAKTSNATQPESVPWKITTVADGEPGEPLIISGTIYGPDGRTPLPDINLYIYQTDATGRYSTTGGDNRLTRIHGLMRTKADGKYEFRTIKPGSYPGSQNPAHIHAYVSGPGYPEYWIDEYHFNDDPFITDEQRKKAGAQGSFSPIVKLERGGDKILRGSRDIRVERCSNNCTGK